MFERILLYLPSISEFFLVGAASALIIRYICRRTVQRTQFRPVQAFWLADIIKVRTEIEICCIDSIQESQIVIPKATDGKFAKICGHLGASSAKQEDSNELEDFSKQ